MGRGTTWNEGWEVRKCNLLKLVIKMVQMTAYLFYCGLVTAAFLGCRKAGTERNAPVGRGTTDVCFERCNLSFRLRVVGTAKQIFRR
jgi:hypothetical protein